MTKMKMVIFIEWEKTLKIKSYVTSSRSFNQYFFLDYKLVDIFNEPNLTWKKCFFLV